MTRIQISRDGSIRLPKKLMEEVGWMPGSYLKVTRDEAVIALEKIQFDPFAEAQKGPDKDAFDKVLKKQREGAEEAKRLFEEKIKEPPGEIRPEDKPFFWD